MTPRYEHANEYPNDIFLGTWGRYDLWVDKKKDNVIVTRYGSDTDEFYSADLDMVREYGLGETGEERRALEKAYELATAPPDPSVSPNSK